MRRPGERRINVGYEPHKFILVLRLTEASFETIVACLALDVMPRDPLISRLRPAGSFERLTTKKCEPDNGVRSDPWAIQR